MINPESIEIALKKRIEKTEEELKPKTYLMKFDSEILKLINESKTIIELAFDEDLTFRAVINCLIQAGISNLSKDLSAVEPYLKPKRK